VSTPTTPVASGKKGPGETLESSAHKTARSSSAVKQCQQRDRACVVTNVSGHLCDIAHLFPVYMQDSTSGVTKTFWKILKMFWTADRVKSWRDGVFEDPVGTEGQQNLIRFNPFVQRLHGKAYFALQFVAKNPLGSWLQLKFVWLRPNKPVGQFSLDRVPELPESWDPAQQEVGLMNVITKRPIESGDIIELRTSDPDNLPLPDTRILELQWIMNLVAAISGAAEPKELEDDSDED
ncbi:hypothetical protein BO78DRAFT_271985, partial [Aspergillus sclerotiicarbonarius CBS 121057]